MKITIRFPPRKGSKRPAWEETIIIPPFILKRALESDNPFDYLVSFIVDRIADKYHQACINRYRDLRFCAEKRIRYEHNIRPWIASVLSEVLRRIITDIKEGKVQKEYHMRLK